VLHNLHACTGCIGAKKTSNRVRGTYLHLALRVIVGWVSACGNVAENAITDAAVQCKICGHFHRF
jgi:hypothetical protein